MVGLGEERNEIPAVMDDLRTAGVDFLTIGQYCSRPEPIRGALHAARRGEQPQDRRLRKGF